MRVRRACFTAFQDIPGNWPSKNDWPDTVTYAVWQLEKSPTTGRLHVQGYVEFSKALTIAAIKKAIGDTTAHIEEAKGSSHQNKKYCSKSESRVEGPFEFGKAREQGKRSDLEAVYEDLKKDKPLHEVMDNNPVAYIKYSRGIQAARFLVQRGKALVRRDVIVTVLWGQTGTGKTRSVLDQEGDANVFILNKTHGASQIWWDGYDGQEVLLIDEFYGWIPYDALLRLLDIYNHSIPFKGGFTHALWKRVYITSNKHPREWYKKIATDMGAEGKIPPALERRIHKIAEVKGRMINDEWETELNVEKLAIPAFYAAAPSATDSAATTPIRPSSPHLHASQDSQLSGSLSPSPSIGLQPWINENPLPLDFDEQNPPSPMWEETRL